MKMKIEIYQSKNESQSGKKLRTIIKEIDQNNTQSTIKYNTAHAYDGPPCLSTAKFKLHISV